MNPGTLADNYIITKSYGTLHVDERPDSLLYQITVVSNSNPEANGSPIIYDGLKHTASNFVSLTFTTADGHPYTVTWLTANVSAFDAGTYPNTIHGNPTVLDEYGNDVTDQFYTELVEGNLVIRKRQVTITVPSDHATMMYNGDSLKVDFENIDITTLADRDTLKSGYVISEGYTAGAYHCNDGFFMATDMTGVASQHNFSIIHGASDEYSAGNSITNYRPKFQVTLTITKRRHADHHAQRCTDLRGRERQPHHLGDDSSQRRRGGCHLQLQHHNGGRSAQGDRREHWPYQS